METYSYISLEFTEDLIASQVVQFDYTDGDGAQTVTETWGDVRYESGIVPITTATGTNGEMTAANFAEAFSADYNVGGLFVVEQVSNVVTIKCTVYGIDFENIVAPDSLTSGTGNGSLPFDIAAVTFSAGSTCSKINISVTTSKLADEIIAPYADSPVTNPIVFEWNRNLTFFLQVKKSTVTAQRVVRTPAILNPSGIRLNINDNPAGASVEIIAQGFGLTFTYSLNGSTYQAGNVFSNLMGGSYTAYVKDQFGCVTQKHFELDGFGINDPFFKVPEENSIRFANRVTFGDCGNYKTDFNTLSCEVDVPLPYKEIQQFQACDVITTQFKSNYANHTVEVNGSEFPITKKTDFMRRKDRRDAVLCNLGDGTTRTGIYFNSGNLYNYDTGADIGDYTLNGALPEWGKAGNYVKHPNGNWYLIEDVLYLDSKGADVLVISTGVAPATDYTAQVSCFYNFQEYDVYEFTIDFASYIGLKFQVRILGVDVMFDEVEFLSEVIDVQVRHKNTIEIQYSNDENTDMYYFTGIINKIRMELESKEGSYEPLYESYDTDTDSILLSADVRKLKKFVFSPMSEQMMDKLIIAVSQRLVTIDGVPYKIQSVESEKLGQTNTYDVILTMKLRNSLYNSNGLQFDETGLEIPALIPTGTGYVKYQ